MADLEGKYSAYLPVAPKAACEAILKIAEYPRWWPRTVATSLAKGVNGKAMVGSRIGIRIEKTSFDYEVKRIDTGHRIEFECIGGPFRGNASWTFASEGNGTLATFEMALNVAGLMARLLGKPADIGQVHERVITSSLHRLAANLAG